MSIRHILASWHIGKAPEMTKEQHAAFEQGVFAARFGMEPQPAWTPEQRAGWIAHTRVMETLQEMQLCAN